MQYLDFFASPQSPMEVGESCKNTRWVRLWSIAMSPTTQEDTRNLQNCFHPFAGRARAEEGREGGRIGLLARIANVGSALMEGHHSLNFEAALPHHLYDLLVRRPVIVSRSVLLHNSPPDVHHDALHTRALERHQACVESPSPGHGVVHAHAVQRQHDEHGHATSGTFASRGLLEGILLPRPKLCLPVEDGLPEIFRVCCTSVDLANSELRGFLHASVATSPAAR